MCVCVCVCVSTLKKKFPYIVYYGKQIPLSLQHRSLWRIVYLPVGHVLRKRRIGFVAVCSPLVAKSGPTGAEHVARSQLDRYVLFLIQSVIIKCEIQCSYKRAITLLNNVYLRASYTYIHAHCDRCARAYATADTAHSIIISKSYRTFTTLPTGNYSVFFMEDFSK